MVNVTKLIEEGDLLAAPVDILLKGQDGKEEIYNHCDVGGSGWKNGRVARVYNKKIIDTLYN
jgi:hypothetical protein